MSRLGFLDLERHVLPALLAVASVALGGASCNKKSAANPDDSADEVLSALDRATIEKESNEGPKKPIDGVDLAGLDGGTRARFDKLVDSLVSPCGKAQSLRKSATVSKDCKRSLYAARYVAMLLSLGAEDDDVRKLYGKRYVDRKAHEFKLGEQVAHVGPLDAPVVIVEFYDYGCPVCVEAYPVMEKVIEEHPHDVVVYYKQNPIVDKHPNSGFCARGALAALKQGKFKEMHKALFEGFGKQSKDDVFGYAREIGLDMVQFEKDYNAAEPWVSADDEEGNLNGVRGTPTIFVNGQEYSDPVDPEFFDSWIQEELAVNR